MSQRPIKKLVVFGQRYCFAALGQKFAVHHGDVPYAYGYRFETRDRTIVISGDLRGCPELIKARVLTPRSCCTSTPASRHGTMISGTNC
jgi:hypothetical protein